VALQDRPRHDILVLQFQRESMEKMIGGIRDVALGISLQEHERPFGMAVQQRRCRCEDQNVAVTGMLKQGLFRERQKPRCHIPVCEGVDELLFPLSGFVQHIAERKGHLRHRSRGHGNGALSSRASLRIRIESHEQVSPSRGRIKGVPSTELGALWSARGDRPQANPQNQRP
jgi:hypothetical protein